MSIRIRTVVSTAAAIAAIYAVNPAHAQTFPTTPITLPHLPGETPLQQSVANAVATMCVHALDGNDNLNVPQQDLHNQCHGIAGANVLASTGAGDTQSTLGALTQVSGNQISTQGALATRVSAGQFANISGRINALRFGSSVALSQGLVADSSGPQSFYLDRSVLDSNTQADGFAPSIAAPLRGMESQGSMTNTALVGGNPVASSSGSGGSAVPLAAPANPWGVFVQGSYSSGHHDLTANESPFDFHASSVTAGVDYNFGSAVLGGSIGYDDYDASFTQTGVAVVGGSAQVKGTSGSLYGAWFGQDWSFSGIATYGSLSTNLSRVVNYTVTYANGFDPQPINNACNSATCVVQASNTLRGSPNGNTAAVGATGSYQYSLSSWDIVPSLSGSYRRASFDSFSESAAIPASAGEGLPLAFGNQIVESFRSILGIDISRPFSLPFGVLTPIIRAEWDHEFKTGATTTEARYAYDPSLAVGQCLSCFALPTDASPANYGVAGGGVSVLLARRLQAFVYDEALFGFANYRSNSISVGVRGQF